MDEQRDWITEAVIGAAIEVHRSLGPGLMESAYAACLAQELRLRGVGIEQEVPIPIDYKGVHVDCGYRIDLLVEREVVVELKAVRRIEPIHQAQLLTYLRCTRKRLGLLINFNGPVLSDGVRRLVNPDAR